MTKYLAKFPELSVFIVVFSFNIVQDIIIRYDVIKMGVLTGIGILLKLNLEIVTKWVHV